MKIDLTKAKDSAGEAFPFSVSEDLPDFEYQGMVYRFAEPVSVQGLYQPETDGIHVTAKISAMLTAPCDRCLADTKIPLDAAMAETFTQGKSEETYLCSENELVLDAAVMDNIVLNIPMHVLCSADCKGLCPHCGKDMNKASCDCDDKMKKANSPFAALNGLFSEKEL